MHSDPREREPPGEPAGGRVRQEPRSPDSVARASCAWAHPTRAGSPCHEERSTDRWEGEPPGNRSRLGTVCGRMLIDKDSGPCVPHPMRNAARNIMSGRFYPGKGSRAGHTTVSCRRRPAADRGGFLRMPVARGPGSPSRVLVDLLDDLRRHRAILRARAGMAAPDEANLGRAAAFPWTPPAPAPRRDSTRSATTRRDDLEDVASQCDIPCSFGCVPRDHLLSAGRCVGTGHGVRGFAHYQRGVMSRFRILGVVVGVNLFSWFAGLAF